MIHVCFAIYDKAGHYSKFLGTTICSLFENTSPPLNNQPSVNVHILHDNTLTEDNRDKLIQLVERYGQLLKFYNVEELCADKFAQIIEFFPNVNDDRHSIATFYRFFIQHLLPQDLEKVLYLDADIIVNFDFTEFWQIELGNKPFGAVPEFYQISDKEASIRRLKKYIPICGEGVVNPEDYFNAGVMMMNLKVLREEEETILAGMKFISEHPQFTFLDQDILNYCFSTSYLKLPTKFNRFVLRAKNENEWNIQEKLYHYATSRTCFVMDSRDPYNQLFMKYFIKTPWVDDDTKVALSGGIPFRKKYPISVIIPLYNMEEYVGECLDSLLLQTFQAFEVIVVDDCSTDNSVAIVESYKEKFNGRLRLTHTEKNSGTGGYVPRNIGLRIAQGDYIYILDADDMILTIALESFYSAAILYDADVVYTSTCYRLYAPDDISLYQDGVKKSFPNVNTEFTINDPKKNLNQLLFERDEGNLRNAWSKFLRRDFLLDNKLFFPEISNAGDFIWVIDVYCHARRFLRISTPFYLRRMYNTNSVTRKVRDAQEQCLFWFAGFVNFAKHLHRLVQENEILAKNPLYSLMTLRKYFDWCLNRTEYARKEFDSVEFFNVLYSEFSKNFSDSEASLLSLFFSFINGERKTSEYYSETLNKFNRYFTARIDIKSSTQGDFQILSVSDPNAYVRQPYWLNKDGIGYQIQSYAGSIEIVAKATTDGKINLSLKGLDIRKPEDNSKRIPYWIDYTKLIVNNKVIFKKVTPAWHDKSYNYNFDVKADEEIKIQTEWLPHNSDI